MNCKTIKILVAGAFKYPIYQEALSFGLRQCGVEVKELVLSDYKTGNEIGNLKNTIRLIKEVNKAKPNLIFLYRVDNIWASCLRFIKHKYPSCKIFIYHNDDPFRKGYKREIKHYHYKKSIKYADITYVYRQINIDEAFQEKAKRVELYMSHYTQADLTDYTLEDCIKDNKRVVFVGHYENDNRIEYIDYLFKHNINLHIYGHNSWIKIFQDNEWPIEHLHSELNKKEYREIVHSASIGLAFFSTANRDKYTRRCFEIPIFGTLLLAPQTDVMTQLFNNGENAIFYTTKEDLLNKILYYNENEKIKDHIAYQGYLHVRNGGFSEIDRAKKILCDYKNLNNGSK